MNLVYRYHKRSTCCLVNRPGQEVHVYSPYVTTHKIVYLYNFEPPLNRATFSSFSYHCGLKYTSLHICSESPLMLSHIMITAFEVITILSLNRKEMTFSNTQKKMDSCNYCNYTKKLQMCTISKKDGRTRDRQTDRLMMLG